MLPVVKQRNCLKCSFRLGTILESLTDVGFGYRRTGFEVGNGPGDFNGTHISPGREVEPGTGDIQQLLGFGSEITEVFDLNVGHTAVELLRAAEAISLKAASLGDTLFGGYMVCPIGGLAKQIIVFNLINRAVQVDTIKDRTRDFKLVALNLMGWAATFVRGTVITAGAGIGGSDQYAIGWIFDAITGPGNTDNPIFERLA